MIKSILYYTYAALLGGIIAFILAGGHPYIMTGTRMIYLLSLPFIIILFVAIRGEFKTEGNKRGAKFTSVVFASGLIASVATLSL